MSREGLTEELAARSISILELKYSQPTVSVYRGQYQSSEAAIKVIHLLEGVDYHLLEVECGIMRTVDHPNIVKLFDCFWLGTGQVNYFVIITEWCQKDLGKDISQRSTNDFPWREPELLSICKQLIGALNTLQNEGIVHRDIKPENVFLPSKGKVKLGDFGSAKNMMVNQSATTLIGTPYYLSPKLREAFSNGQRAVEHDAIKSDVYSLGLTFLVMANLGPPPELAKPSITDADLTRVINNLSFSENLKYLLRVMLVQDEAQRWSFCQLWEWVSTHFPDQALLSPMSGSIPTGQSMFPMDAASVRKPDTQTPHPVSPWVDPPKASQYSGYPDPQQNYLETETPSGYGPQAYPSPQLQLPAQPYPYYAYPPATPPRLADQTPDNQGYVYSGTGKELPEQYQASAYPEYTPPPYQYQYPQGYQAPQAGYQASPAYQPQGSPQRNTPPVVAPTTALRLSGIPQSAPVVVPQSAPVIVPQSQPVVVPQSQPVVVPRPQPVVVPPASVSPSRYKTPGLSPHSSQSPLPVRSPALEIVDEAGKLEVQPLLSKPPPGDRTEPVCLECKQEVDRFGDRAACEVVQLYCQPMVHMFCSRECFRKSAVVRDRRVCPVCEVEVDEGTMALYMGEEYNKHPSPVAPRPPRPLLRMICCCFYSSLDNHSP